MELPTSNNSTISTNSFLPFFIFGLIVWLAYGCLYRLYWGPVAGFPGPKLAGLTFWYEFYYDVIKKGQYTFKIKDLHQKYGRVVRINPYEIHISDPNFYDTVYVGATTRKTDKWWWSADMFAVPDSSISTISHALHRRRRAMFSNHFSAAAVHRLEPLLREKIELLFARLEDAKKIGEPVPMWHAFSALTADIITAYSFPEGYDHLGAADYAPQMHETVNRMSLASHLIKQCPWLMQLLRVLPLNVAKKVQPDLAVLIDTQEGFVRQVRKVIEARAVSKRTSVEGQIFDSMLDAEVPDSEKTVERLAMEAQLLVFAGMLTTAHTLMTIVYHVLANPNVLSRLMDELSNMASGSIEAVPLSALEKLPYLTAVIYEGLRVGCGVPHRLQRVSPDTSLQYGEYTVPPGTPVSMSAMLQHEDPEIFPEPKKFQPERWLPIDTEGQRLHRYLVAFSKGTRQCVGMNLAYGELYLTLAGLFSRFGNSMELWDTVWERDIATSVDAFNPLPTPNSRGLMVVIKNV